MKTKSLLGLLLLMVILLGGAYSWKNSVEKKIVQVKPEPAESEEVKNTIIPTKEWMNMATTDGELLYKTEIPREFEPSTNFAGAKFTVGRSSDPEAVSSCLVNTMGEMTEKSMVKINGVDYTVFNYSDAGAGNFYDTTSYRAVYGDSCYAMEYTIHSTNIHNYSPDQGIKEFDVEKVRGVLEGIVKNFK